MSDHSVGRPQIIARAVDNPDKTRGWTSWITTTDHKKIGIMYLATVLVFFVLGGVEALLMRTQLAVPDNTLLTPERYNQILTMHGTTMVFLVVVPVWAGFANYLLPLMIGARDVAFPRLNAWSYWMYLFGGLALYASMLFSPPEAGWFSYVPLSLKQYSGTNGQEAWIYMVHLTGLSSIIGAINFIATIHNMRAPGMGWGRMPLFVWTILIYAYLIILALTSLAATVTMLLLDRNFGTNFFDPDEGGSALLWQHLFWFFGHPEVYILALPFFGIASEVLPVFSRKPLFGYKTLIAATIAIAGLAMTVWAHHLFTTGAVLLPFFSFMTLLIAVPTGVKFFNWAGTMWKGQLTFEPPMLYAIGFLIVFLFGGITGIILASPPLDFAVSDSYFVVAHFHYVLVGTVMFSMFAGFYFWWPKMTGKMLNSRLGKAQFWLMFVGFNMTFLVQHWLGAQGMPRRIANYPDLPGDVTTLNIVSTVGSWILALSILVFLWNVYITARFGQRVTEDDPWGFARSLEWATTSPPPRHNFLRMPRIRSESPAFDLHYPHVPRGRVSAAGAGTPQIQTDRTASTGQ